MARMDRFLTRYHRLLAPRFELPCPLKMGLPLPAPLYLRMARPVLATAYATPCSPQYRLVLYQCLGTLCMDHYPSPLITMIIPPLLLYDTPKGKKRPFIPRNPQQVALYVCGPTVYDSPHIGNARGALTFDLWVRLLRLFWNVNYIRNITDIDDKILAKAQQTKIPWQTIVENNIKAYHADMECLGLLNPSHEPRATQHVPQIIDFIQKILSKKHAYTNHQHVLFDVTKTKHYGQFARKTLSEMIPGKRVTVENYKKNPLDFILWKPSHDNEAGWNSPWGRGRPGWHIECSVMCYLYCGETIDIHAGGADLIFPHHQNELAQTTALTHKPLANYWLHNGLLTTNNAKMSKTVGNIFLVKDLLKTFQPEVLRLALIKTHYRQQLSFSTSTLKQAKDLLDKWYRLLLSQPPTPLTPPKPHNPTSLQADFLNALMDDLNIPKALSVLHVLAENEPISALKHNAQFLGLLLQNPQQWFQDQTETTLKQEDIQQLVLARQTARKNKNFKDADAIRDKLLKYGIALEDKGDKTFWRGK